MKLTTITISTLGEFINSDLFKKSSVLPITTHRALSHLKNPRAKADDVVLIIAVEEDEIMGYIGLLPDDLYVENEVHHVSWLSCWWVQDGTGNLGIQLFLKALKLCKKRMVITDFTPHIKTIIEKMRLFHFAPTTYGIRGFMRFNTAEVLPSKKPIFKTLQPLLHLADKMANVLNHGRLKVWQWRRSYSNYEIKKISHIDNATDLFVKKHQSSESIKRSAKELNWILKSPWVLESSPDLSPTVLAETKRYYFSSTTPTFQYYPLQIFQNNQLIGFLLLMNRNGHFKLPYAYFDKNNLTTIVQAIYEVLYQKKAVTFTVFNPIIKTYLEQQTSPFFYKRLIPKDFAIGKNLDPSILQNAKLQDGDGDSVFA